MVNQNEVYQPIDINLIDSSPFQTRMLFGVEAEKALAADMKKEGQIEPIIVREKEGGRYELVGGERRVRAARFLLWSLIAAKIVKLNDTLARAMCVSENLFQEKLTFIEEVFSIISLLEARMEENPEYHERFTGERSIERIYHLLSHLRTIDEKDKEHIILSDQEADDFEAYLGKTVNFFSDLPQTKKWVSFLKNELIPLKNASEKVIQAALEENLNKTQLTALVKLEKEDPNELDRILLEGKKAREEYYRTLDTSSNILLQSMSGAELNRVIANSIKAKQEALEVERIQNTPTPTPVILSYYYQSMGWSNTRIQAKLTLNSPEEVDALHAQREFLPLIVESLKEKQPENIIQENIYPDMLVWKVFLNEKASLEEKMKALRYPALAGDYWKVSGADDRFSEANRELPPALIANFLRWFVKAEETVVDLVNNTPTVPQTCLLLGRQCLSFSVQPEKANFYQLAHDWARVGPSWPIMSDDNTPDWLLLHPPTEWLGEEAPLAKLEDVLNIAKKMAFPGQKLALFTHPPLGSTQAIQTCETQGWKVNQVIPYFTGYQSKPDKTVLENYGKENKLYPQSSFLLICQP